MFISFSTNDTLQHQESNSLSLFQPQAHFQQEILPTLE